MLDPFCGFEISSRFWTVFRNVANLDADDAVVVLWVIDWLVTGMEPLEIGGFEMGFPKVDDFESEVFLVELGGGAWDGPLGARAEIPTELGELDLETR